MSSSPDPAAPPPAPATSEAISRDRVLISLAWLVALLVFGIVQLKWGEAIEVTGGLGFYDGRRYGEIAMNFSREVFEDGLDAYRLQRILPSGIVHLSLRGLGLPLDARHVRDAFQIYNLVLLLVTAFAWMGIARRARIDAQGEWLGFGFLFLNFANLKMPFYNPVLTDSTALALGGLLVYFHLRRSGPGVFGVLAAGSFVWPTLSLGGLLYLFPGEPAVSEPRAAARRHVPAGLAAAVLLAIGLAFYRGILSQRPWPALTVAILLVYVFVTISGMFASPALRDWRAVLAGVRWSRLLHLAALQLAVAGITAAMSTGSQGFNLERYVREIVFYTSLQPALFLVAHAVYFGPIACLALVFWPEVCRAAHSLGVGMTLYVTALLAQGIDPETRHLIQALPALVLVTAIAARSVDWPSWAMWGSGIVGLVASKAWWPINQGEFGSYLEAPLQYYYMNHGGAMSPDSYRLQGAIVLAVVVGTIVLRRRLAPAAADPEPEPASPPPERASRPGPPGVARTAAASVSLPDPL